MANVYESLDETSIRKMVLPKIKLVFEKNQSDLKIMANVLQCIERTLEKLDKSQVRNILIFVFLVCLHCYNIAVVDGMKGKPYL